MIQFNDDSYRAAVSSIVFCGVCVLLNIGTIAAYRTSHAQPSGGRSSARSTRSTTGERQGTAVELRLTIYAFCTFFSQLLVAVDTVMIFIGSRSFSLDTLFFSALNQSPLVNDVCTVALPAWLMLWASRDMRVMLTALFQPAPNPSITSVVHAQRRFLRRTNTELFSSTSVSSVMSIPARKEPISLSLETTGTGSCSTAYGQCRKEGRVGWKL